MENFFNNINFKNIIKNLSGVNASDNVKSTLFDFQRVLDQADLYAYKNWLLGELVDGPEIKRYTVKCVFMWPYKLMPDPRGALRLTTIRCRVVFAKGSIDVPVKIKSPDDLKDGLNYPKSIKKKVWYVMIEIPIDLMNDVKEGSIDIAGQSIDLGDIDEAYDDDLDNLQKEEDSPTQGDSDPFGENGGGFDPNSGGF